VLNNNWSIDWISVTFKNSISDTAVRAQTSFGFKPKAWTIGTPKFGYAHMMQHPFGHVIMSNPGRPDMGVHLSFSGRSLRAIAEGGHTALSMLEWALREGGKITRLDLAVDLLDIPVDIPMLADCERVKDAPGSARKWSLVRGGDGGCTAYIGSRQSDKFMRIYDKAAETKQHDRAWTRFELEIKGDAAKVASHAFAALREGEHAPYIKGVMKAMFNPIDPLYQELMSVDAVHIAATRDTDDRTLEWLLGSVAKTFARTIHRRSDVDVAKMFLDAVEAEFQALQDRPTTTAAAAE
jgi:DNA relaxase NicK